MLNNFSIDAVKKVNAAVKHPMVYDSLYVNIFHVWRWHFSAWYFLNYRSKFPECKIPTLEEAVQLCLELKLKMFIDVKGNSSLVKRIFQMLWILRYIILQNDRLGGYSLARHLQAISEALRKRYRLLVLASNRLSSK